MATQGKSKAERVARWRSLIAHEEELLADLPHPRARRGGFRHSKPRTRSKPSPGGGETPP